MPLARWAFNIRQPLLLENVEPLVTRLTDDDSPSNDSSSRRPPNIVPVSNLLNFLPKSEADSLLQLRLEDDMRRALVGRLMIHAFFTAHHNCPWENLVFDNTESTKPVLVRYATAPKEWGGEDENRHIDTISSVPTCPSNFFSVCFAPCTMHLYVLSVVYFFLFCFLFPFFFSPCSMCRVYFCLLQHFFSLLILFILGTQLKNTLHHTLTIR